MKKKLWSVGIILAMSLTACGTNSTGLDAFEKIQAESQNEVESGEAELTGVDQDGIPKHVTSVLNNDGRVCLNLDADVKAKGYNEAKIYTLELIQMDDEYLISLAEKLFDDGKYTSQMPYKYWEKADLKQEEGRLTQVTPDGIDKSKVMANINYFNLNIALSLDKPNKMPVLVENSKIIYEDEAALTNHYDKYEKERFCNLKGSINGKEYLLCYKEIVGGKMHNMYNIELRPLFPIAINYDKIMEESEVNATATEGEMPMTSALSDVDMEPLKAEADEILKKIGCSDFTYDYSQLCYYYDPLSKDNASNGYDFFYERSFDELEKSSYYFGYATVQNDDENAKAVPTEQVQISMNEKGLVSFNMHVFYKVGEPLTEKASMLSFEQINESVEQMMKSVNPQSTNEKFYETIIFDQKDAIPLIHLSYLPVEYNEKYVYMPMWCYSFNTNNLWSEENQKSLPVFAVSAVDGKIYNFQYFDVIGMEMERSGSVNVE